MSNEQIISIDEATSENVKERETIIEDDIPEQDSLELAKDLQMHPTMAFAELIRKDQTPSGIYIPESAQDKELTPLVKILAVGKNVEVCEVGDYAYVNPSYMNFAKMNGIEGVVLLQDAVIAVHTGAVEDED